MPTHEVQLIRRFTNHDVAYIEIQAKNEDEAHEIALERCNDDDIDWSEGEDYDVADVEIADIDRVED